MSIFVTFVIAYATTVLYYSYIHFSGIWWLQLPLLSLILLYYSTGFKTTLYTALFVGLFAGLHNIYIMPYTLLYLSIPILISWLHRSFLPIHTRRSVSMAIIITQAAFYMILLPVTFFHTNSIQTSLYFSRISNIVIIPLALNISVAILAYLILSRLKFIQIHDKGSI